MLNSRIRAALVVVAASAGLAGCTSFGPYGGIGVGIGSSPYGYGSYGYDSYGYDPYYYSYGSPLYYGSAYGYDPYGWYHGSYYPGVGYWVYDTDRNRRELTAEERAYWRERIMRHREELRRNGKLSTASVTPTRENWSAFGRRPRNVSATGTTIPTGTSDVTGSTGTSNREAQRQRVLEQRAQRQQVLEQRQQARSERQQARSERQEEARQQLIQERRETRRARKSADD